MPVSIRGTGGGGVTLDSGAAASNTTLTLPNVNGTVVLSASPTFTGTTTTSDLSVGGTASITGALVPSSSFLRNRIINGAMQIWQRGTSFTASFGTYTADRWMLYANSITATRSTDVPSGFPFSISVAQFNADFASIAQRIESVNAYDLAGQQVTVSFWAKSTAGTSPLLAQLEYPNAVDNFSTTTLIQNIQVSANPSGSWTRYTATFNALPSQVANGLLLIVYRTNAAASTTLYTGIQLEVGSAATPFERRQFGQELALCQRYYSASTTASRVFFQGYAVSGSGYPSSPVYFKVSMRASPTVTLTNSDAFGFPSTVGTTSISQDAFTESRTSNSTQNSGYFISSWTASAEL